MFKVPERFRIKEGMLASDSRYGCNGAFYIPFISQLANQDNAVILIIASDQLGWEHVSVSLNHRSPSWNEMCVIKNLFWDEEDMVVQYHPPKSRYKNIHKFCLHMWRKAGTNSFCEMPPIEMV